MNTIAMKRIFTLLTLTLVTICAVTNNSFAKSEKHAELNYEPSELDSSVIAAINGYLSASNF